MKQSKPYERMPCLNNPIGHKLGAGCAWDCIDAELPTDEWCDHCLEHQEHEDRGDVMILRDPAGLCPEGVVIPCEK